MAFQPRRGAADPWPKSSPTAGANSPPLARPGASCRLARLAAGLSDDYTVYHGVHWTQVERGSYAIFGEILQLAR